TGLSPTLAQNGGPEVQKTLRLLAGSNAIDNGSNAIDPTTSLSYCGVIDARSVARGTNGVGAVNSPQPGDCDIGAYEYANFIVNLSELTDNIAERNGEKLDLLLLGGTPGLAVAEPKTHDISIQDADQAGVNVNDGGNGTTVTEGVGAADSFSISLNSRPDYSQIDPNDPDSYGPPSDVT